MYVEKPTNTYQQNNFAFRHEPNITKTLNVLCGQIKNKTKLDFMKSNKKSRVQHPVVFMLLQKTA